MSVLSLLGPRPYRRPGRIAAASVLLLSAACSGATDGSAAAPPTTESHDTAAQAGHVHGLGVDPESGTLYAATHTGLFDLGVDGDGSPRRVAGRWQDTMAFTVVGPGHFLGSGHPDMREADLPAHLGLIESTDAGRTWRALSLQGEADFHALAAAGSTVWGYDALSGRLLMSEDGQQWREVASGQVGDLAVDPGSPRRALATTPEGVVAHDADSGEATPLAAPPMMLLDWPVRDLLVGVGPDGRVHTSRDGGDSWRSTEGPVGDPQALTASPGSWFLATSEGIYASEDDGRSWARLTH